MKIVRKSLVSLLAVAISIMPITADAAARGHPFYVGADSPEELAQVIEASLKEDASGNTVVKPRDPGDRAFATPNYYFQMLKQNNSRAPDLNSVHDLPKHLRRLVRAKGPPGRYWSACIYPNGPKLRCELRAFKEGEEAWVDPLTAVTEFMQSCTNPIEGKERNDCYVVSFDYLERRGVRWVSYNGSKYASVSTHLSFTEKQFERVYADTCYFVEDENGRRKPEPDCPTLFCPPGSQWPTVELARAVGLPTSKPPTSIHFRLKNGRGKLSLPGWALTDLNLFVPCVVTIPYPVSVTGYQGWRAVARFDKVELREFQVTRASGKLNRVLTGSLHY